MSDRQKKIILGVFIGAVVTMIVVIGVLIHTKDLFSKPEVSNVEATPAPTAVVTPEPTKNPYEGMVRSSMTGEYVKPSVENSRPFAVMINNLEYAFRNQKGTAKADILYEALAEGGITRMLAIYQNVKDVKKIGSVRSARHYYVQFAYEWDAVFCHFGHTHYATSKIEELGVENLSGLSGYGSSVYARTNKVVAPHNVYTTGKKLVKGAKKLGYSVKKNNGKRAEHFGFYEVDTDLANGKTAKTIKLPFSYYSTCRLKYNKNQKTYFKYEYKQKHMDIGAKKQLNFKNVIVQLVKESNIDHNGYQTMEITNDSRKGYYFTNGKYQKITWEREEDSNTMVYYDANGDVLTMNPGKTYIAVFPKNRNKLITIK